jgi:alanine dehydrogenase
MPGAVPHTSTYALTNATFPYALEIAAKGIKIAVKDSYALKKGINIYHGKLTCEQVANSLDIPFTPIDL